MGSILSFTLLTPTDRGQQIQRWHEALLTFSQQSLDLPLNKLRNKQYFACQEIQQTGLTK